MSTWHVAVVREQGVTFAVASVKDHVIDSIGERDSLVEALSLRLGCPTVLAGERYRRTYGRRDIVQSLRNVRLETLPWRQLTIAA